MKSVYFIGGTGEFSSEMGRILQDDYGHKVTGVGRRTGHAVEGSTGEGLDKIAQEFLDYDVVINFISGGMQYYLTQRLLKEITENDWRGYWVNFGSTILLHNKGSMDKNLKPHQVYDYIAKKHAISSFSKEISRNFMENEFRYTLLNCGMLDNPKMRKLPNYRTTCLKPNDLANVVNFCVTSPTNWHLHELYLDGK